MRGSYAVFAGVISDSTDISSHRWCRVKGGQSRLTRSTTAPKEANDTAREPRPATLTIRNHMDGCSNGSEIQQYAQLHRQCQGWWYDEGVLLHVRAHEGQGQGQI